MNPRNNSLNDTNVVAQRVARQSYGKLVAWLTYQWRDLAAAEDAMSAALLKALELWPSQGIPENAEAWLLRVAQRELLQVARRQRLHNSPEIQAVLEDESFYEAASAIPDARLKLMFVCAHPAIEASIRPALMLQTVLGVEAKVVAQSMLIAPSAMAQRLVRVKNKIRQTQMRFEEPNLDELPDRLHAVLESIYAAYGLGWDAIDGGDVRTQGLRNEALYLAQLLCDLLPSAAEAMGLLALLHFCEARVNARFVEGQMGESCFVPLSEQNTELWDFVYIRYAEQTLKKAAQFQSLGVFQLEAAIQSAHCQRLSNGQTPWKAIAHLYEALSQYNPSIGVFIAQASAWAQCGDLSKASSLLLSIDEQTVINHQPYWVAKAHLAKLTGDMLEHQVTLKRAIGLTQSPAIRRYLQGQL